MQGVAGTQRLACFDIELPAELARQAIAEPEGEGVGLAVEVCLRIGEERKVHIVNFVCGNAVAGIENTEGQTIVR